MTTTTIINAILNADRDETGAVIDQQGIYEGLFGDGSDAADAMWERAVDEIAASDDWAIDDWTFLDGQLVYLPERAEYLEEEGIEVA
jgi:hypothetical protein